MRRHDPIEARKLEKLTKAATGVVTFESAPVLDDEVLNLHLGCL